MTTTILQCDASLQGLGAWVRQVDGQGNERIVAMCSRTLTPAETRYSNIERECLAVQYGLEKFEYYLLGRHTIVETDHAPLQQIFKKNVADAPARLQRMLLKCMKFDIEIEYHPGPTIPVADALSRVVAPQKHEKDNVINNNIDMVSTSCTTDEEHEVNFIEGIKAPINTQRIRDEAARDPKYSMLKGYVHSGWPENRKKCPESMHEFWNFRCDLVLMDGLVMKGDRFVIPEALRAEVRDALHTGHQGETKCILLAKESVFWPGITNDIKNMVQQCSICTKYQHAQARSTIMQPDLPMRPWEKLGTDIFDYRGRKYLLVVDYYSRFILVRKLPDITAGTVSATFATIINEFGIPDTIIADFLDSVHIS